MNWLEHLLSPAVVRALGWTLLHSLWQGAVVALALAGLLLLLRHHTASIRYHVAGVALLIMLGLSTATFGRYYLAAEPEAMMSPAAVAVPGFATINAPLGGNLPVITAFAKQNTPAVAHTPAGAEQATLSGAGAAWLPYFDQQLPLLVTAWLLGLLAMTLRFLGGLAYLDRLRHYRVRPLPEEWQRRLTTLGNRAGLRRAVTLLESALVKAPLVAGHLRPVILLPLGTVSGLSPAHLEAILAHELAHIIRRDYLMNLIQSLTEILFFYHPGVWFVNACLRTERENCCDDMATALCGNPLTVAQALTNLAELGHDRLVAPRLAVAAVGPDGSLLGRVRRLVGRRVAPSFSEGFMAALVVLGGVVLLAVSTAFSMVDLPLETPRKQALIMGNAWRAELLPGLITLPPASPPQLGPVRQEEIVASAEDDKDKDKKRRKDKDGNRVVIIQEGARGRRDAGTVVLERDKKGRVKELYVNGNRIDAKELDAARKQSKDNSTQVIRLNAEAIARADAPATVRFDYGNGGNLMVPGKNWDELREVLPGIAENIDKHREELAHAERNLIGQVQLVDSERVRSQALRAAEQSLRETERRADSESEREKIRAQIEDVRQDQERIRERQQAERNRQQAERDKARAERDKVLAERDARNREADEAIIAALLKDGFIKDKQNFQFMLNASELRVNGAKQSDAAFAKYRKLYEQNGRALGATGSVMLNYNGSNVNRVYSSGKNSSTTSTITGPGVFEMPPVPPVPSMPAMPPAPPLPAVPPAPPLPAVPRTSFNSVDLGSQLREDGLIEQNDKSYQFQLNNAGLTVNGRRQSAELADKYRKLLGEGKSSRFNMNVSIQE